ncbi:TRAP transporter small permease [Polycladidibacter hongkongensis]|uniref:TRAP transporter small permease n=1 Tax=Polycladidibacter hongkongensis TaxID=1647556 RepID=UPI00082A41F9|nr:TRAP transporter small permease [Pseudovibrio hongkongensis]
MATPQLDAPQTSSAPPASLVDRAVTLAENLLNLIAATSILLLMLLAVAQVVGRNLFNAPVPGFIDITEQAMAVFAFLGVAFCQRLGGHIRMELVLGTLKGRVLWLAEVFGVLIILIVVSALIYGSYFHFERAWEFGDSTIDISIPTWPSKVLVPFALSILWLRLALQMVAYCKLVLDPSRPIGDLPHTQNAAEHAAAEIEDAFLQTDMHLHSAQPEPHQSAAQQKQEA